LFAVVLAGLASVCGGCFKISVSPTCPAALDIGESATVAANPTTPGEIPSYQWLVIPTGAGTFADAEAPTTTFTAQLSGDATIRMVASDGLFVDVGECVVAIGGSVSLAVSLSVQPSSPTVDDTVTLTCTTTAGSADTLTIDQLNGTFVTLTETSSGVSTFDPPAIGDYTFRCIGESGAESSQPATVTVTVIESGRGGGRGNR